MGTLDQLIEAVGEFETSIKFYKDYTLHLVNNPGPEIPFKVLGSFGYRSKLKTSYTQQYFVISKKGELYSKNSSKEIRVLLRACEALEKEFSDDRIQVLDMMLPKSHGFSGIKRWHLLTREQFKHLA